MVVGRDPDDDARCVLAVSKCNLAKRARSIAYRVEGVRLAGIGEVPRIDWLGPVEVDAAELLQAPRGERGAPRRDAAEWLWRNLTDGPVPVVALAEKARQDGLTGGPFAELPRCWRCASAAGGPPVTLRPRGCGLSMRLRWPDRP